MEKKMKCGISVRKQVLSKVWIENGTVGGVLDHFASEDSTVAVEQINPRFDQEALSAAAEKFLAACESAIMDDDPETEF